MEEKLRQAKKNYDAIEIPGELSPAVQDAIRRGRLQKIGGISPSGKLPPASRPVPASSLW